MSTLLPALFDYNAWANADLFNKLESIDREKHQSELQRALKLISHYYVVSRIFSGHLQGVPHGFLSDNLERTPMLNELSMAVTTSDQWYLDYVSAATPPMLSETVAFTFTDGDKGYMTREEMLAHVVLHGGYHRGGGRPYFVAACHRPAVGHLRGLSSSMLSRATIAGRAARHGR